MQPSFRTSIFLIVPVHLSFLYDHFVDCRDTIQYIKADLMAISFPLVLNNGQKGQLGTITGPLFF